jgi:hypothetical protein
VSPLTIFGVCCIASGCVAPDRLVSGSIGNAAQYGKRLRAIDALVCQAQTRLMAAKPRKSRVAFSAEVDTGSREENASNQESRASVLI